MELAQVSTLVVVVVVLVQVGMVVMPQPKLAVRLVQGLIQVEQVEPL